MFNLSFRQRMRLYKVRAAVSAWPRCFKTASLGGLLTYLSCRRLSIVHRAEKGTVECETVE